MDPFLSAKSGIVISLSLFEEDSIMEEKRVKNGAAKVLTSVANSMLSSAANSRCFCIYHQPKQPENMKRFRKF